MRHFYGSLHSKNIFTLTILVFLIACTNRPSNPVVAYKYEDINKQCNDISIELDSIESEIARLTPKTKKAAKNAVLGAAGAFLLFPWFFMDFSDREKIEIEAYRNRYNNLITLADEKDCGIEREIIPKPLPDIIENNNAPQIYL